LLASGAGQTNFNKVQIQTSVRAGQANINYCTKFQQLIFNLAAVTGRRNANIPPAAIPER
jgi:hypothetical protein